MNLEGKNSFQGFSLVHFALPSLGIEYRPGTSNEQKGYLFVGVKHG